MSDLYRLWFRGLDGQFVESRHTIGLPGRDLESCQRMQSFGRSSHVIRPADKGPPPSPAVEVEKKPEREPVTVRRSIWDVQGVSILENFDATVTINGPAATAYLTADELRDLADACDEAADVLAAKAKKT